MEKNCEPRDPSTGLNPLCDPFGKGESERYIEIPWALSKYSNEQTVLDIGYANAEERYIKSLLSLKIPDLHGLDISERKIEGLISHVGDIRKTNFENNYFDLIFCISTIEHIGRDNSVYKANFTEDLDKGDLNALKEIFRITKIDGKIVITVPFGKFFNYGWFIQYDENRLNKLLNSCPFKILEKEFFIYENGWHKCDKNDLKDILYRDNNAPAAAGLVCLLLKKMSNNQLSIQNVKNNNNYKDMNDKTNEICNDDINAEEIMQKIRDKIYRIKTSGEISHDPDAIDSSLYNGRPCPELSEPLQRDLSSVNSTWDLHNSDYYISSHHKFFGKFLVKGRELIHGEVRRYVDPIFSRQTKFNAGTARLLVGTFQLHAELEKTVTRLKQETDQKIKDTIDIAKTESDSKSEDRVRELDSKFARELESRSRELESRSEARAHELFSQLDADIHARASLAHVLEDRIQTGFVKKSTVAESIIHTDTTYFLFEERFRGSREDIKLRQLSFLPYFEKCSRVLDIGCGRGEFLEILRDHNIGGIGIDIDADMIAYCHSRQLSVVQSDAITYLEAQEDKSLDGIFIDQVVEHLEPKYLVRLLALCHQKLKFGYFIVVETVNPLSFVSFVNFYIDMTHKRPVHPETLQFLMCAAGFRANEKKFFSPVSDEGTLKKIAMTAEMDEYARNSFDLYNQNIEKLNTVLFGPQDYAIIGKK